MKNSLLFFSLFLLLFACNIDDQQDVSPQLNDSEIIIEANFIGNNLNERVLISDGIKLQVIKKGNGTRSTSNFRFLVSKKDFPEVAGVEIISLSVENTNKMSSSFDPLFAFANSGKGTKVNLTSPAVTTSTLIDKKFGFSLIDEEGKYIEGGFFDMDISGGAKGGLEVNFSLASQTEFDVILSSAGAEKLKVIQTLQTVLTISEKEAIKVIENLPAIVKARTSKEEANQLKAALEAVGATVDLKRKPAGSPESDEQTEFDVILSSAGTEKFKVIQTLQSALTISEKEAIKIVENLPAVVQARASKEEANQLKAALEAVGATVDLK